jgi:methyltransferase (TIGR00027 family)
MAESNSMERAAAFMAEPIIQDVSDTAFWVAHFRSLENERPDALFHDRLAARLAGERGRRIAAAMPAARMTEWTLAMRTCIIDEFVRAAIDDGVDSVLNLGAGLDARPYRMELPASLRWIDADYPRIVEYMETSLAREQPRCRLERAKVDLVDPSARRRLLAHANAGAKGLLILTEGVVPYLSLDEAASLAQDLRALDRARYWIVDYFSPEALRYQARKGVDRAMQNARFRFAPPDWVGFFAERGWRSKEIRYLAELGEQLHRPIPLPRLFLIAMKIIAPLVPKERRGAFRKFAGFLLLAPS